MSRQTEYPIEPLFTARWSPRAFDGRPVEQEHLMKLFEAARWAPSSNNNQPWRFVYAAAGTPHFEKFFDLLAEGNKPWCRRAGALVIVASKNTFDNGSPARTHSYDTGAAWMSLSLQAEFMGIRVHGMQGFDYDRAASAIGLPENHSVEAMFAAGYPGKIEDLPEKYQPREKPSDRKPLAACVFEGAF